MTRSRRRSPSSTQRRAGHAGLVGQGIGQRVLLARVRRRRLGEIRNFDRLRHYGTRPIAWVKLHIDLLDDDEYLGLSGHQRAVLHGLWLERARLERDGLWALVSFNRRYLTRRLGLRVTSDDLEALEGAGFIHVWASKSGPTSVRACTQSPCKSAEAGDCSSLGDEPRMVAKLEQAGLLPLLDEAGGKSYPDLHERMRPRMERPQV
jgi:hypothetical protein